MRNDINLIPKRNNIISAQMMFLVLLVSMGSFILMGYYGLYLPLNEKKELNDKIKQSQEELLLYSDVEETYISLLDQINNLNNINTVFELIKSNSLKMTQIFKDFQKNIPKDIVINKISYTNGELLMEGLSPTYKELAQYIVNLRKLDYVLNVGFTSAEYKTPVVDQNNGTVASNGDEDNMYLFNITVSLKTYIPPTVEPTSQDGDTTDEKGGEK